MKDEKKLISILDCNKSIILTAKFKPNEIRTIHIGNINGYFNYFLINKGIFIYIGYSANLAQRLCSHKGGFEFDEIIVIKYKNKKSAFLYEKYYIKYFNPKHNFKYCKLL